MKKILSYSSIKDTYTANAVMVWCFDARFNHLLQMYRARFQAIDVISIPGGAKVFAIDDPAYRRQVVVEQIKASITANGATGIVLMMHEDCAMNGRSAHFKNKADEVVTCSEWLMEGKQYLKKQFAAMPITCVFASMDGLYEVKEVAVMETTMVASA
jgi:hypothetical protein